MEVTNFPQIPHNINSYKDLSWGHGTGSLQKSSLSTAQISLAAAGNGNTNLHVYLTEE